MLACRQYRVRSSGSAKHDRHLTRYIDMNVSKELITIIYMHGECLSHEKYKKLLQDAAWPSERLSP